MKRYGYISMTLAATLITAVIAAFLLIPGGKEFLLPSSFAVMLVLWQIFNLPIIKVNSEAISIVTINPFQKNIRVRFSDVSKIYVNMDHKMRIVFHMNDGTYQSINTSKYSYDMKPFYHELAKSGVDIISEGAGTIDWVK